MVCGSILPAGTAVRFEPGEEKEVELVAFGGNRNAFGFNNLVNGDTSNEENKADSDEQTWQLLISKTKQYEPAHQQDKICQYVWANYWR